MNDQDAFDEWFAKRDVWPRITYDEVWHAALAWLRSQGEPVAWEYRTWYGENTVTPGWSEWLRVEPRNPFTDMVDDRVAELKLYIERGYKYELRPLFLAPQPTIPDGWLDRGKAALAECRAADDLWSDDRLLSHLFNAMTAATQPVAPGGWKLVPMEPTPTMLSAGAEGSGEFIEHAHFVWTQMLAAAPEPSK